MVETNGMGAAASEAPSLPHVEGPGLAGLTADEAAALTAQGKANAVKDPTSRSYADIVRANVFTLFNGIILAAMVMVLLTGSWRDSVFGFVIIINTGIGIITEIRAKRTLDRLSILVASNTMVRRGGHDVEVPHDGIVLGDLMWVRAGEQVSADGRVERTWGLELDESMLTGESHTVRKQEGDEVLSGATAVSGLALVRVTAVGERSYAARLTAKAKVYRKTVSDLSRGINTILKFMTFLVVPLCALLTWSQIRAVGGWSSALATGEWRQAVVSAVAGVVGMIPEGLVLLTSLNFAVAAMRLARHHTLVQELESVETLARVDALNLDKTGTITDGGIAFDRIVPLGGASPVGLGGASSPVVLSERSEPKDLPPKDLPHLGSASSRDSGITQALYDLADDGNPNGTGRAVLAGLSAQGFGPGEVAARVPFSSERKWSAIVKPAVPSSTAQGGEGAPSSVVLSAGRSPEPKDLTIWYLGAPEVILASLAIDAGARASILAQVNAHAADGARVLLIACARLDGGADRVCSFSNDPRLDPHATPVALVLCAERIRPDAERTLAWFREQGVRCRVISGDNPVTVGAIARRVKLTGERKPVAMDARDLPDDIDELARTLEGVDVLGRVLPDQKKAIVQALHAQGHVVAMTGDGVNDALAIKEADLGIAMGNAASATKSVAQVVLVDSKFSHLPEVMARGRQVMANMERVAGLFLVKTVYSALISLGVVLTAIPFPYLPRHITYIGALTIGMPAFILALAPNTRRYVPGFLRRVVRFAVPGGVAIGLSVLASSWLLPGVMGWDVDADADLAQLRAVNAILVFALSVAVLARVSRPLNTWRGWLVAAFGSAGVIGLFIPFVAGFFALQVPTGRVLVATLVALGASAAVFALCHAAVWAITRIGAHCPT